MGAFLIQENRNLSYELMEEQEFIKEVILRKFILNELDLFSLNSLLTKFQGTAYTLGRLDGEKFSNKGEMKHAK